ncbi:hypothetical protein AB8919_08965 [Yersinia enterocolitica]|uniref:hypothetical protein n=1 Tax=Yersinia enterocolitica TaxID=630 RepID=UPI003CFE32F8
MAHRLHIRGVFIRNAGNSLSFTHHAVKLIANMQRSGYPSAHRTASGERGVTQSSGNGFALIAVIKTVTGSTEALLLLGLLF